MKNVYKALFGILTFGLFVIGSEAMAGNISISRTDQGSSISVSANANMVRGLVANLNTSSSDYLNQLYVYVDGRDATGNIINPMRDLGNLRLYISGEIADYTSNILQTGGKYYYSFNTYRNINTGSNEIELRFDTNSSAISGDTISFMINTGSFSGDIYSRNTIIGSAKSATFYIKKLGVNVSIIDSQANSKRVSGSSNFTGMEVGITPNDGGDLLLNGFDFNISSFGGVKGALNNNYVIDATLVYSGRDLQTIPFNNSGFVHFNYLNILLKKSTQSNIYIKVNTTLSHPSSSINDVQYSMSNFDINDGANPSFIDGSQGYTIFGRELDVIQSGGSSMNSIGGRYYFDYNNSKKYDTGDNGVEGVNVYIYKYVANAPVPQSNMQLAKSMLTDYYGTYNFTGLVDGQYQVRFGMLSGFDFTTIDIPEYGNQFNSGYLYIDTYGNTEWSTNIWTGGLIDLTKGQYIGANNIDNQISKQGILANSYKNSSSDFYYNGVDYNTVTLSGGKIFTGIKYNESDNKIIYKNTIDAGIVRQNTNIYGSYYYDKDTNGYKDGSDYGLSGQNVNIYTCNDNGPTNVNVFLKTIKTDASGNRSISGLRAGNYLVNYDLYTGSSFVRPMNSNINNNGRYGQANVYDPTNSYSKDILGSHGCQFYGMTNRGSLYIGVGTGLYTVSGDMYFDNNMDGIKNIGDSTFNSGTAFIGRCNADGNKPDNMIYQSNTYINKGSYSFENISSGYYYIGFYNRDDGGYGLSDFRSITNPDSISQTQSAKETKCFYVSKNITGINAIMQNNNCPHESVNFNNNFDQSTCKTSDCGDINQNICNVNGASCNLGLTNIGGICKPYTNINYCVSEYLPLNIIGVSSGIYFNIDKIKLTDGSFIKVNSGDVSIYMDSVRAYEKVISDGISANGFISKKINKIYNSKKYFKASSLVGDLYETGFYYTGSIGEIYIDSIILNRLCDTKITGSKCTIQDIRTGYSSSFVNRCYSGYSTANSTVYTNNGGSYSPSTPLYTDLPKNNITGNFQTQTNQINTGNNSGALISNNSIKTNQTGSYITNNIIKFMKTIKIDLNDYIKKDGTFEMEFPDMKIPKNNNIAKQTKISMFYAYMLAIKSANNI